MRPVPLTFSVLVLGLLLAAPARQAALAAELPTDHPAAAGKTRVIVLVWDGLRPDSINATDTPRLFALAQSGVNFRDHHSSYPSFTMMNAAAFATGALPRSTGFYGNTIWVPPQEGAPPPKGHNAAGHTQDFSAPVFTEDYAVLDALNAYYGKHLLLVRSLFQVAHEAGLVTVALGKTGAAYLQDLDRGGLFLDENTVSPPSLASELQDAHFALPANSGKGDPAPISLNLLNGDPTGRAGALNFVVKALGYSNPPLTARDGSDATQGAAEDAANRYMLDIYTRFILPKKHPDLSVIWFRTPDNAQHAYGPGSPNAHLALQSQDRRLGELLDALRVQGLEDSTNLLVVSDHGHSSVSGPQQMFPLRTIIPGRPGANALTQASYSAERDPLHGFSFSGDVRSADLLTFQGFQAFDGRGCMASAMSGIKADGSPVYLLQADASGSLCNGGEVPARPILYSAVSAQTENPLIARPVASFQLPSILPSARSRNGTLPIVVAPNGGTDYFYVPSHDPLTVEKLVRFLQSREEYGAVFVDSRYGSLPGAFLMRDVNLENASRAARGQPDVVVSFSWDAQQSVQGMSGIEFASMGGQRGSHGSFGPTDIHNTLIAAGPAFRSATVVTDPSGNVDLAPTVAYLLGLKLPEASGRILDEALRAPSSPARISVRSLLLHPPRAAVLGRFALPTDPTGARVDTQKPGGRYTANLAVKDLSVEGRTYRYFDYAEAIRR